MKTRIHATLIWLALAGLVWCLCETALAIRAWRGFPDLALMVVSDQATAAQGVLDARMASIERRANEQLVATRAELLSRVDALIARSDARVGETLTAADQRLAQSLALVDQRTGEALRQTSDAAAAATDLLASTGRITASIEPWLDCGGPGYGEGKECLQSKIWWMTLKADSVMTNVAVATPKLVEAAELSARSGQQAAESAAQTSANLATITRPGPRWLRYAGMGLSVAAPASQVALPFVLGRAR
jgi:hypothetical protein